MQHKRSTNPDFQARHYRKIAALVRKVNQAPSTNAITAAFLVEAFGEMFAEDNPQFSREGFEDAIETGKWL